MGSDSITKHGVLLIANCILYHQQSTRGHRQVSKVNARKSSRSTLRLFPVHSGQSVLGMISQKQRPKLFPGGAWHVRATIKSFCDVMFRLSQEQRRHHPLDLLIALILYLSTDAKTRRASLPPQLSSWQESRR